MRNIRHACILLALLAFAARSGQAQQAPLPLPLPGASDSGPAAIDPDRHTLCLATPEGLRSVVELTADGSELVVYPMALGGAFIIGIAASGETHFLELIKKIQFRGRLVELRLAVDPAGKLVVVGIDESGETHFAMPRPDGTWVWLDGIAALSALRPLGPVGAPKLVDSDTAGCRRAAPAFPFIR